MSQARNITFSERLREIDMFFQGTDRVHQTMRRVAEKLEAANIPYAIAGGMAVNAHRYERTTHDVDFLVTQAGFLEFRRRFVPQDFDPAPGHPRRFVDRTAGVTFDFLVTGLFPGKGEPGPIAFPDPTAVRQTIDDLQVVDLPTLIQLKLAARRWKDFADVVYLIRENHLDGAFQDRLHPSVHGDYIECLEEKRRDDEYELRQDRALEEKLREAEEPPEPS